jgi:hypothetical protein
MSELVLTAEANPGALGANLSAFFFNLSGVPSYVGNDGVEHNLLASGGNLPIANANVSGNITLAGNFVVSSANSGVTGNATINKATGRVIAGIAATVLVVTNNMVTANSHVFAQPSANDATGRVTAVTPAAGNFTISLTAPAANMPIDFFVVTAG